MNETPSPTPSPTPEIAITPRSYKQPGTTFQTVMYWSLAPAIFLVPLWLVFGRLLFGAGGWIMVIMMLSFGPLMFVYQVALTVLAVFGPKRKALPQVTSILLAAYYGVVFILGLLIVDGGDTPESVGSALTMLGLPSVINSALYALFGPAFFGLMITLLAFFIVDVVTARKLKRQAAEVPLSSEQTTLH